MLYKNHKKVNLFEEPLYKEKQKEFEAFIKGKSTILFKTHDKLTFNKTGVQEPDRIQSIPVEVVVPNAEFSDDTWIYLEKAPKVLQNGENDYDRVKQPILVTRTLNVPTTQKDKIFFLMYLSTAARNGRLFAFNEEAEDERKLQAISKAVSIDYLLTGEYSPLTKDNARRIAKSFGIENVDKLSDAKLLLTLKAKVDEAEKLGDTHCNVAAFIKAMEEEDVTNVKAIVQQAIDEKKIMWDELEGTWFYIDESGARIKKIVAVDMLVRNHKLKRLNTLHQVFLSDTAKLEDLKIVMGFAVKEVDFSKVQYGNLKKWAGMYGFGGAGTHEEVAERASKFYHENKDKMPLDLTLLLIENKKD